MINWPTSKHDGVLADFIDSDVKRHAESDEVKTGIQWESILKCLCPAALLHEAILEIWFTSFSPW